MSSLVSEECVDQGHILSIGTALSLFTMLDSLGGMEYSQWQGVSGGPPP